MLEEANKIIEQFINELYLENVKKLIVVTGKGPHSQNDKDPYLLKDLSILKYSVLDFIEGNQQLMKNILELKDADIKDGGSGAFYIYLKI
jgi:DNA-nicking Smr family endonuclease